MRCFSQCLLPLLLFSNVAGARCSVVSTTKDIQESHSSEFLGTIRYHHDSNDSSCSNFIMIGVGTFMSVNEYDILSHEIVKAEKSFIVVILDHAPGDFKKTSSAKFSNLLNEVSMQICDIFDACNETAPNFFIGGHSASGEAAIVALQDDGLSMEIDGFIGLDPFEISSKTINEDHKLNLPALYWGFTRTTCLVKKEEAAEAAYALTSPHARLLYLIDNDERHNGMTHCVFTDTGCGVRPVVCASQEQYDWVYTYVATSIKLFVSAVVNDTVFEREYFQLNHERPEDISLYLNGDSVNELQLKQS